jgi:hypothetical protein
MLSFFIVEDVKRTQVHNWIAVERNLIHDYIVIIYGRDTPLKTICYSALTEIRHFLSFCKFPWVEVLSYELMADLTLF